MPFSSDILPQCWFLCGPTACGKSQLSLGLAERLNAEILALDSMTLYRGMDIGTAKPTMAERNRIPHHLIDILAPHEECSLADYVTAAQAACQQIVARGRTPLFVGGTGLYLRGLLRGVFEGPPADWNLRALLEQQLQRNGSAALFQELRTIDPLAATRLHPNDTRRVIRAIEVYRLTGQPLSQLQQQPPLPVSDRPRHVYWLSPPRDWLYRRIDDRVVQMFQDGLIDEVKSLLNASHPPGHTARQGLGYKEVIDWLQSPAADPKLQGLAELIETIQTRSRQFAKRQHTWFRNLEECRAFPIDGTESADELCERFLKGAAIE